MSLITWRRNQECIVDGRLPRLCILNEFCLANSLPVDQVLRGWLDMRTPQASNQTLSTGHSNATSPVVGASGSLSDTLTLTRPIRKTPCLLFGAFSTFFMLFIKNVEKA